MYIVIMAGGGGTRLWPKSRLKKPKQLQSLLGAESMLKNTIRRVLPIAPKEKIYIAANVAQVKELKKEISPIPIKNIILEPAMRNTGPCIGLAATLLSKKTDEPIVFLPSDQYIGNEKKFHKTLFKAKNAAEKNYLVTIGIRPSDPDTGLGYIKMGQKTDQEVYEVEKFVEKPDLAAAKKFLLSGKYLWNAGMFVARPNVILKLFEKHAPQIYKHLEIIRKNPTKLQTEYTKIENISIDYAIAERAEKIAVVPGDFDWSDIGSWSRLLEKLSQKTGQNVVVGCAHYGVDTSGCLIHGTERVVATIGLKDVIVVDTPDVVLVCHKDKTQDVKKIVEKLKQEKKHHLL